MKALTISFSSDKTDCKKLFLAWFRHSRSLLSQNFQRPTAGVFFFTFLCNGRLYVYAFLYPFRCRDAAYTLPHISLYC